MRELRHPREQNRGNSKGRLIKGIKDFFANKGPYSKAVTIIAALATIVGTVFMIFQCAQRQPSSYSYSNEENTNKTYNFVDIDFDIFFRSIEDITSSDPVKTPSASVENLQETAFLYFEQEDYLGALKYLEKTYKEQTITLGVENNSTISTEYLIALAYYKMYDYANAIEYSNVALAHISVQTEKKEELYSDLYYILALSYFHFDNFDNALKYFKKTLTAKKTFLASEDPELITYLELIAITQLNLGESEGAMEALDEAVRISDRILDNELIMAKINAIAGRINYYQGNYHLAIECYQDALNTLLKDSDTHKESISTLDNNLAGVYIYLEDYDNALYYLKESIKIIEQLDGDLFYKKVTVYNNISVVYIHLREFDLAKLNLDKTIKMVRSKIGDKNIIIATLYSNYALMYELQGRFDEAESYIELDIAICEDILGEHNLDIATSYFSLAEVYASTNRPEQAYYFYDKCLAIRETLLGEDHLSTCEVYFEIAKIHHNYEGSNLVVLEYLRKAYKEKVVRESPKFEQEVYLRALETYLDLGLERESFESWLKSDW